MSGFVKFVREMMPHLWLRTNRPWTEMQTTASSAAILTHMVNPAGFSIGYPNLMVPYMVKCFDAVPADAGVRHCDAASLDDLITDFFQRVDASDAVAYDKQFPTALLQETPWREPWELAHVVNHNLLLLRRKGVSKDSFPDPREMSLECLYGLVLRRWEEARNIPELRTLAVTVPLFTAQPASHFAFNKPPSARKAELLANRIFENDTIASDWRTALLGVRADAREVVEAQDVELLKTLLADAIARSERQRAQRRANPDAVLTPPVIGATMRKKFRVMLRQLNARQLWRDPKWDAQTTLKRMKLGLADDYRLLHDGDGDGDGNGIGDPIDEIMLGALTQALRNLPTDIQVANMATLRNPQRHFLFDFLRAKADAARAARAARNGTNPLAHRQRLEAQLHREMETIARLAGRLQALALYKADAQNNVASMWTERRRQLLSRDNLVRIDRFLYGPATVELALDLYPAAHAFSFTYGRRGGYLLPDQHAATLDWLLTCTNPEQKLHFVHLLALPRDARPAALHWLDGVPAAIRAQAATLAAQTPALPAEDTLPHLQAVNELLRTLDAWTEQRFNRHADATAQEAAQAAGSPPGATVVDAATLSDAERHLLDAAKAHARAKYAQLRSSAKGSTDAASSDALLRSLKLVSAASIVGAAIDASDGPSLLLQRLTAADSRR